VKNRETPAFVQLVESLVHLNVPHRNFPENLRQPVRELTRYSTQMPL